VLTLNFLSLLICICQGLGDPTSEKMDSKPRYRPATITQKAHYDHSFLKLGTTSEHQSSPQNFEDTQEVFPNISKQRQTREENHSELKLLDLAYSSDGKYIGAIHNSGDCDIYDGSYGVQASPEKDSVSGQVFALIYSNN